MVNHCGTLIWRPENGNILWPSRRLIICTEQRSIYISAFPNTSKKVMNHEISRFVIPPLRDFSILGQKIVKYFFHFSQSNKRHLKCFACVVYVFRARIMQSVRCKMDFETETKSQTKHTNELKNYKQN